METQSVVYLIEKIRIHNGINSGYVLAIFKELPDAVEHIKFLDPDWDGYSQFNLDAKYRLTAVPLQ